MAIYILATALLLASAGEGRPVQDAFGPTALVGSWRLVSYEDRDADGAVVYPYGRSPAGLLVYDATGHMAIQIMKEPPPDVAADDWDKFTVEEKVALYEGYVAYFGRYEVDTTRGVVIHLPEADLSRLYIGAREVRHFELAGDRLALSEQWTQSGREERRSHIRAAQVNHTASNGGTPPQRTRR
jgi:Lipocalin-like domain